MSLQCIARVLSRQIRGSSSCGLMRQLNSLSPASKSFKPIEHPSLVSRVQHFKTSPVKYSVQGHDHSKLWTIERAFSAGLIVILPAALLAPNTASDVLLAVSLVTHSHWGIEAIVVDYIRPSIFGAVIPKASLGLVYLLSIVTLAGLLQITFMDKGLGRTIRNVWAVSS